METIKNISKGALGTTKQFYLAGLGVVATLSGRSKNVFDRLVEKGEAASQKEEPSKAKVFTSGVTNKVKGLAEKTGSRIQGGVTTTLTTMGIPSRDEIQSLTRSVEQLTEKVKLMQESVA